MTQSIALSTGDSIDGFTLGERVHAGAMGALYRVTGPDPGFPMVMKVPKLRASGGASETLLGYETEAMILPALQGPHVPRFVAQGGIMRTPYLVMEWIDGEGMAKLVKRAPLAMAEVVRTGAALAEALHDVHAQGVVHLDLKPDNAVLTADGRAVLLDFGLSRHAQFPDLLAEEQRFLAGSAPYIAPEPLLGVRSDPRSDLFSLGVLLYELATGELPFDVPRTQAGLRDRLWREPVPPVAQAPVEPWLQEVILRCLEPDASRRYQSAAHLAFDLRNPGQVELTERSQRTEAAGFWRQAGRWWRGHGLQTPVSVARLAEREQAPVVMVAVDTVHESDDRHPALQFAVSRILSAVPEIRVAFVTVIPAEVSASGARQVDHRVRLRGWIAPFGLPAHRHSLHVIEAFDPASALLEYARANLVDLIVIGAPPPSQARMAWWRSVASTVTANAPCSVHVVRRPTPDSNALK